MAEGCQGTVSATIVDPNTVVIMNSDGTFLGLQPLYCDTTENGDITCYF